MKHKIDLSDVDCSPCFVQLPRDAWPMVIAELINAANAYYEGDWIPGDPGPQASDEGMASACADVALRMAAQLSIEPRNPKLHPEIVVMRYERREPNDRAN